MTDWVTARFHNASRRRGGRRARYEMVINLKTAKALGLTRPITRKSYRWRHDTVCRRSISYLSLLNRAVLRSYGPDGATAAGFVGSPMARFWNDRAAKSRWAGSGKRS